MSTHYVIDHLWTRQAASTWRSSETSPAPVQT